MDPYPRTWAEIDLPAMAHNLRLAREHMGDPNIRIALVCKADAYGHGLLAMSRYALRHGADWLAVATVQEGIALRDAGVEATIMVMSPMLPIEAEQAVFYDLDVFVEAMPVAIALSQAAESNAKPVRVHLKVDTGLHRFGCSPECAPDLAAEISALAGIELVGIGQHFADSSRNPEFTMLQVERFQATIAACAARGIKFAYVHASNSAGAMRYPEARGNVVRIGLIAYGIDPFNLLGGKVRPTMKWKARITSMRDLPEGMPLGYALTFTTARPTRLATIGVGYGDGYPRSLSNKGVVEIKGQEAPVVGLVAMDQVLVDVTDVPGAEIGDEVTLMGGLVRAERLAALTDTTSHEIVTRIMSRVPRRYIYAD